MSDGVVGSLRPEPAASGEEQAIAVVGMAGRFPGSADLDELWQHLRSGTELISRFSRDELLAEGVDPALLDRGRSYARRFGAQGGTLFGSGLSGLGR